MGTFLTKDILTVGHFEWGQLERVIFSLMNILTVTF